jgi:hypothetical protein
MKHFPNAKKSTQIFNPREFKQNKIGHFGFFKQENQNAWTEVILKKLS